MLRAFLAVLLLLVAPVRADELSPQRRPDHDPGGSVVLRAMEIARLEASGTPKRIEGTCSSACTLYLGLSTACFDRDVILGFHGPRLPWGLPMSKAQFDEVSSFMASYYPPRIARAFMDRWRHRDRMRWVRASRLIERGEARACDP